MHRAKHWKHRLPPLAGPSPPLLPDLLSLSHLPKRAKAGRVWWSTGIPAVQYRSVEFVRLVASVLCLRGRGHMKAISASRTGVDAADRVERGLGPFATLAARSALAISTCPRGRMGAGKDAQPVCRSPRLHRATRLADLRSSLALRHPCCPIYPRHPYLPKGAKGAGNGAQPVCRSTDDPTAQ